ncbi:hypothetical protein F5887DRAFT_1175202 [Amanita rubescens]|nr:hypothetical protein F5887DRAFT_1175202 [Amanita rubescens]
MSPPPRPVSDAFSLAHQRPTTYNPGQYPEYDEEYEEESEDEDVFAFLPPSTDPRRAAGQNPDPNPLDDHQSLNRPSTTAAANVTFPSPTFDPSYSRFPAESVYSSPSHLQPLPYQLQPPPQSPPSTASHSNPAENDPYRLKRLNTSVRPGSSKEVRISLPNRELEDGSEPDFSTRSIPVTRGRGESIVSAPISAAGNAECGFSDDMDRTMMEDVKVRSKGQPPSIPESMSLTPSMLEEDATSREGSIK